MPPSQGPPQTQQPGSASLQAHLCGGAGVNGTPTGIYGSGGPVTSSPSAASSMHRDVNRRRFDVFIYLSRFLRFYRQFQKKRARYERTITMSIFVCHKSVFYRNGRMDRANFSHGSFLHSSLFFAKVISLQKRNKGTFLWALS